MNEFEIDIIKLICLVKCLSNSLIRPVLLKILRFYLNYLKKNTNIYIKVY